MLFWSRDLKKKEVKKPFFGVDLKSKTYKIPRVGIRDHSEGKVPVNWLP